MSAESGEVNLSTYGPYGPNGREVALAAAHLLDNLLAPKASLTFRPFERPRWDSDDLKGFEDFIEVDSGVAFLEPAPDPIVSGDRLAQLFRNVRELNASLPFREGERHWLIAAWLANREPKPSARVEAVAEAEDTTVISAGLRQDLDGRDLVRRWAAWRREEHEFDGQDSRRRAQTLLRSITHELLPAGLDDHYARLLPHAAGFLAVNAQQQPQPYQRDSTQAGPRKMT